MGAPLAAVSVAPVPGPSCTPVNPGSVTPSHAVAALQDPLRMQRAFKRLRSKMFHDPRVDNETQETLWPKGEPPLPCFAQPTWVAQ